MLSDLNHPRSKRIIKASFVIDAILDAFRVMTRSVGEERQVAIRRAVEADAELRELAIAHCGKKSTKKVFEALDTLNQKMHRMSALPKLQEPIPMHCVMCGASMLKKGVPEETPYCLPCLDAPMNELHLLWDKFDTWEI